MEDAIRDADEIIESPRPVRRTDARDDSDDDPDGDGPVFRSVY